jgi:nuclear protein localization protein 4 homolog
LIFDDAQNVLLLLLLFFVVTDFMVLDSQYEFKLKRQENAFCKQVSLDIPSAGNFQSYIQNFGFQRKRFGFLYGKFVPADDSDSSDMKTGDGEHKPPMKCIVEAIYEPPQHVDAEAAEGFVALQDEKEDVVNTIAKMLGLKKVGWIFGHEERTDFTLTAAEVILAAEYQLEDADGVNETPFVTVTVSPTADGTVTVEAFQVSLQCMSMVAEEALEIGEKPSECTVNETFTAIQEGKASKTVENSFFLTVVPIVQHTSETFIADFPMLNRDVSDRTPSHVEMKRQLQKSGSEGWTFVDRLADFNLLIYLSGFLDLNADLPKICASIVDRGTPLDSGYQIIIKSMAGLEGSY